MSPADLASTNFDQRGWRAHLFSLPTAAVAIFVATVLILCRGTIGDPDLWWHLRNGQQIFTSGHIPRFDTYSFTAYGAPWFDHSWLSELIYYASYHFLGLEGVYLVFVAAAIALVLSVFFIAKQETDNPLSAALLTASAIGLLDVGFTPRAQHFGWLCFVGIFAIGLRYRRTRSAPLWLLPILFALWINFHGGWPFGFIICGIIWVAGLFTSDIGPFRADPWSPSERSKLLITGALSAAALFANPFGYRLVAYPFDLAFKQQINVSNVSEWASVNFGRPLGLYVMGVLLLVFMVAATTKRRWRIADVLLLLFVLFCGMQHVRFLLVAGLVLPPVLASYPEIRRDTERKIRRNAVLLTAGVVISILSIPGPSYLKAETDLTFPSEAVAFLKEHPIAGNMFNLYDWGGYLDWELRDDKVFVDPRADIFEWRGVLRDYFDVARSRRSFELLDRWKITHVFIASGGQLDYLLANSSAWRQVYRDDKAVIYERTTLMGQP